MISFKKKYTLNMVGKVVTIGDIASIGNGESLRVVGITSIEIKGEHIIVEGYGIQTEY